jgi:hypothetical protein
MVECEVDLTGPHDPDEPLISLIRVAT